VEQPFRLPVQWVNRPNLDFRGFCGTIASGAIRPGDQVRVASSGLVSRVSRIVTMNGDLEEGVAGQAVTVTLTDEIDISRGDMLTATDAPPLYTRHPEAHLVWLHDTPLQPGQLYLVKTATGVTPGRVTAVHYAVDVNTLEQKQVPNLKLNEIGLARLELDRPVPFDPYHENRDTGSFILIDRFSNATVAAGMVIESAPVDSCHCGLAEIGTSSTEDEQASLRRIRLGEASATNLNVVDLTSEWGPFALEISADLLSYLEKGNRILFRLRDLWQVPAVALLAYENTLAFEFDRTASGISLMVFKRGSEPRKGYGDDGTGI
jgi:sulfate adenylyltransferase subunit 1